MSKEMQVSAVKSEAEIPALPNSLSNFSTPYLRYWAKEALDIDGEVEVTKTPGGDISGLFVYDNYEQSGTIFTRSREVFEYYYQLKRNGSLWAELDTGNPCDHYDILTMALDGVDFQHRFKHKVVIETRTPEIERFMNLTVHYALNPKWVRVAIGNGDRCFVVREGNEIAGIAWLSLVKDVGRVPDLYVKPQFRRTGIARDLFYARLIYLQSMRAKSYFAEIAQENEAALAHALKVGMKVAGQVFEYYHVKVEDPKPAV